MGSRRTKVLSLLFRHLALSVSLPECPGRSKEKGGCGHILRFSKSPQSGFQDAWSYGLVGDELWRKLSAVSSGPDEEVGGQSCHVNKLGCWLAQL